MHELGAMDEEANDKKPHWVCACRVALGSWVTHTIDFYERMIYLNFMI